MKEVCTVRHGTVFCLADNWVRIRYGTVPYSNMNESDQTVPLGKVFSVPVHTYLRTLKNKHNLELFLLIYVCIYVCI